MAGRRQAPILQALVILCIVALVSCNDHYRVLGVSPTASNAEIKKVCLVRHVTPFVVLVSGGASSLTALPSPQHHLRNMYCVKMNCVASALG
jgi:hypothetical protein